MSIRDGENGYSVVLPAGYRRITGMAQLDSLMKAGAPFGSPKYRNALDRYASARTDAKFFAMKFGNSDYTNNLRINISRAGTMDAEHIGDIYNKLKPRLEARPDTKITRHQVETVAGTKALRVEYRVSYGQQQEVLTTQIYVIHKGNLLLALISQDREAASQADANFFATSLRFV